MTASMENPPKRSSIGAQVYESFYDFFSSLYNEIPPGGIPTNGASKPGQVNGNVNFGYQNGTAQNHHPASPRSSPTNGKVPHVDRDAPLANGQPNGITRGLATSEARQGNDQGRPVEKAFMTPDRSRQEGGTGGGGVSSTLPAQQMGQQGATYVADKEDLLDQHVAYYLRHHPDVHRRNNLVRKRPGVYELNNREVLVEWQYATEPGGQGFLVVLDGPLRQPFSDYMEMSENHAEYDMHSIGQRSALHQIPKEKRMSFGDTHKVYTRLEAMKVAKEQAIVRETAADFIKDGRDAPQSDLMNKYKKTIAQKLGPNRRSAPSSGPPTSPPQGAPAGGADPAAAGGSASVRAPPQPSTHDAPPAYPAAQAQPATAPYPGYPAPQQPQQWGSYQPPPTQAAAAPSTQQAYSYIPPSQPSLTPPQGIFHNHGGGLNGLSGHSVQPGGFGGVQLQPSQQLGYARWP